MLIVDVYAQYVTDLLRYDSLTIKIHPLKI